MEFAAAGETNVPKEQRFMHERRLRVAFLAIAVSVGVTLSLLPPAFAGEQGRRHHDDWEHAARFADVVEAQALYEQVLRLGKGGPHSGPYTAPLHTDPAGPSYLWGGLDPISLLDRYDEDIETDRGRVIFISRSGSNVGKPEHYLDIPVYPGSSTFERALFRSAANRDRYVRMIDDGSLMIMFGMNCQWGVISGPATAFAGRASHWAQPGLAAIAVERFFRDTVTVLGVNLYSRGDDWNVTKKRWKYAIEAFSLLLMHDEEWERERSEMPVIKVN